MTFFKDAPVLAFLIAALALHAASCLIDLFLKNDKHIKITRTALISVNIIVHLCLIAFMMRAHLMLNEAVLVILISVFFYTFLGFVRFSLSEFLAKRSKKGEGVRENDL